MIKQSDILDESDDLLHQKCDEVTFPMDKKDIKLAQDAIKYLRKSQDEKYAEKHDIRGGMGLALVQLGVKKRIFVISYKKEDGTFEEYTIINPKIISHSEEMIYVLEGEGCLSVNREVDGIIPRYARITVSTYDTLGNKKEIRVREEIAVAFQHEMDHLEGILFVDRINKNISFNDKDRLRAI